MQDLSKDIKFWVQGVFEMISTTSWYIALTCGFDGSLVTVCILVLQKNNIPVDFMLKYGKDQKSLRQKEHADKVID